MEIFDLFCFPCKVQANSEIQIPLFRSPSISINQLELTHGLWQIQPLFTQSKFIQFLFKFFNEIGNYDKMFQLLTICKAKSCMQFLVFPNSLIIMLKLTELVT